MNTIRLTILGGLLLASLPASDLRAQESGRDITSIFPADSYAVLNFAGLSACASAAEKSGVFELLQRAHAESGLNIDRLTQGRLSRLVRMLRRNLGRAGVTPSEIHAVLNGPLAIGVGRPSLRSLMTPSVLLALDTRGREARVEGLMGKLEAMLPRVLQELDELAPRWSSMKIGDAKVRRLDFEGVGFRVQYATHNGYLLIASGQGYLEHSLRVMNGQGASIREHPTVEKGRQKLGGAPLMSAFLNTKPLMRALEPFTPYDATALCDALGVGKMRGLWFGTAMAGKASRDQLVLDFDGEPSGLFKALFSKRSTGLGAEYCAPDSALYWNASVDTEGLSTSMRRLFAELPAQIREEVGEEIEHGLAPELDRQLAPLGMSHRDVQEMLSMFTGELAIGAKVKIEQPQVLLFAKVRDGSAARAAITEHLERLFTGEQLPKLRYRKSRDYWFVSVRGKPISFTPSIAFRGDTIILSPYRQALEHALDRVVKQGASLASSEEFRRARANMPEAAFFLGVRYGQMVETVWPLLRAQIDATLQDFGERNGIDVGEAVPDASVMRKALGSLYASQHADAEGIYAQSDNPFGVGVVGAAGAWAADWLLRAAMRTPSKNN